MMKQIPEILAPVGAREQLEAAVACGADAVYFGAGTLNARRAAANFAGDALREAVEYCHVRGVAVHLALNTIVLERELNEAAALARTACELGVDALIIQDLGLAAFLRRAAPEMPLHASTQMAVHNVSGARQLEAMGFSRVVLAREMSREEIARVAADTSLETEVFVHGALCMCISGQCYMSAVIGERSGNRGLCAQPCRLPFYERENGRCGLSLKDLSIIEHIGELRGLGVSSVKIEGRMKRPEYVAAAVTACKEAREGKKPDTDKLRAVFSRSGFTNGYYKAHLGAQMFGIREKQDVTAAAGVLGCLSELYRRECPRVGLAISFTLVENEPARLTMQDENGNQAFVEAEFPEEARQKPTTPELVEQSLSKLGGTPYFPASMDLNVGPGLCVPVSQMNRMRREALEQLTLRRAAPQPKAFSPPQWPAPRTERGTKSPALRARFSSAQQTRLCNLDNFDIIILPVYEMGRLLQAGVSEAILPRLAVELPRIDFAEKFALQADLERLYDAGLRHAYAGNLGSLHAAKEIGFTVHGGWALNAANSAAVAACEALGCADLCLSFELNLADCKRLGGRLPRGIFAYGHLPLMVVRNCPARAESGCGGCAGIAYMKDRLGNAFPVTCTGGGEAPAGNPGKVQCGHELGCTEGECGSTVIRGGGGEAPAGNPGKVQCGHELGCTEGECDSTAFRGGGGEAPAGNPGKVQCGHELGCTGGDRGSTVIRGGTFTGGVAEVLNHVPLYLADRLPELAGLDFALLWFTLEQPEECARVLEEYTRGGRRDKITRGLYFRNLQ